MQRADLTEALKQQQRARSGSGDATATAVTLQSPTFQQGTLPQYALASQLQALAGQSPQAAIGLVQGVRGPIPTTTFTLAPQPVLSSGIQPSTPVATSPATGRLLSPVQSYVSTPATSNLLQTKGINVLQRQLSSPGIVGLTAVSQGLHQHAASTPLPQQQGAVMVSATNSQDSRQIQRSLSFTPVSSVSASGGTIHHHGQSPTRGAPPLSNLQHNIIGMNINQQAQIVQRRTSLGASAIPGTPGTGRMVLDTRHLVTHPIGALGPQRHIQTTGPPPKKKVKIEEKNPATPEIAQQRKTILDQKHKEMVEIKENYIEHLTEMFFLQNGRNMMDYLAWKKRPTPQLVTFLKSGNLDSDEEEEHLQERRINDEVKVLTSAGSNVPLATPVAISTTLPPSVSALSQQGSDNKLGHGRQLPSTPLVPHAQPAQSASIHTGNPTVTSPTAPIQYPMVVTTTPPVTAAMVTSAHSGPIGATAVLTTSTPSSQLQLQLAKSLPDTKPLSVQTSPMCKSPVSSVSHGTAVPVKLPKSPTSPTRRPDTRQQSISAVYDSTIGSKEAIVERAKQEAQVMQRVAELRKEGMWSSRRLPKVQEPPRNKAHWDYLLEEMTWLAADFIQERKWKKACARKLARMVLKYHQDQEQKELRAEKEEAQKLKKIAGQMAKIVKEFWTNIEKVVQYKQQTRLEEKRKKALDMHLNFIVDQTEKYSSWLTEGLHAGSSAMGSSACGSVTTSPEHSSEGGDVEFEPDGTASDDEETIEREENEAGNNEEAEMQELEALQLESELPIEELLKTLPQEVLDEPASLNDSSDKNDMENENDKVKGKESDGEFTASGGEEMDLEETIEEQETHERNKNYKKELDDLEAEGELSIEELRQKYSGAYDSDFDLPEESEDESSEEDSQGSDDDIDVQSDEDSTTEEEEESEEEIQKQEDVGLEFLLKPEAAVDTVAVLKPEPKEQGPGKEITDIAAEAQSLQPKGYTLETTKVETKVPFLLKHSLREYQHVGLDWLATMQEKRLNGILADEMGLGKTIQTIALLAHLACEKGVWGPHLIVVPTSVMLNWEMECKKWCPSFKILTYYGSQKERKQKRQGWTKTNAFHICITSYKLVVQDHQAFRRKKWKYFILDEAQNIKNFKSQRWQMLLNFQSQRRLLLTGTPLQNSLMELWSLMHFLMPNVFQSHREFKEWFSNPLSGMVEGSQDYNDSLVRRLHKVLRPFLLRRLKDDVEKQMPKKYEHVVMCRLSKRQRYLYDEFMSQTKTRETLATGHFMSVINVLMQLRKVCNHPNLFDPRPIVSPFQTEGIVYKTASLVLRALEYDPLKNIDIHVLYPSLADMERDLPAFIAHRVKKLQTPKNLIVEIDSQPDPPARPKPGRLKPLTFRSVSPAASASGRSSPLVPISQARPASPVQIIRTSVVRSATPTHMVPLTSAPSVQGAVPIKIGIVSQHQQVPHITQTSAQAALTSALTTLASSSAPPVQSNIQAKVVPQQLQGVLHTTASPVMPSQPITVQIQQTEQGTRLMIPTGQLSQLPAGLIQIVQTSTGQQLIATSNPAAPIQPVIPVQNVVTSAAAAAGSIVNGPAPLTTSTPSICSASVMSVVAQVKTVPAVQLPSGSILTAQKPIMRVTPMSASTEGTPAFSRTIPVVSTAPAVVPSTPITSVGSVISKMSELASPSVVAATTTRSATTEEKKIAKSKENQGKKKSELSLKSLEEKRTKNRREKLEYISRINKKHCEVKPVYGQDLCDAVDVLKNVNRTRVVDNTWKGLGYVHCHCAHTCSNPYHPDCYLTQSDTFRKLVHTPGQYLEELQDILNRYLFVTPTVMAPRIQMHVSHPSPSSVMAEKRLKFELQKQLSHKTTCLHRLSTKMMVQFPELRLIEYDCGKLQTLDILLHRLKTGGHRVLIFTQMTKMLDVLEAFLSYHGHRYLRLDGTTKVEQRQALMERFNMDYRIFCFILSTRSGGIGVNLTGADTVIFYDSDWNPTMDAQAQDRCHRIGQTRDVHIYRLISEMTIEENILKKANQKRLLGDLAIEGGNFTTAFFKEQTIQELFQEPSGLETLAKEKEARAVEKHKREIESTASRTPGDGSGDASVLAQFEQALCKAEDETDVIAATLVKAEQKAELAEFDETIPWDEREAEVKKEEDEMSKVEMELAQLDKELSPIERYAVAQMEAQMEPETLEELMIAEEDIENSKKDWELARLKALKEEEERRAELEEDEMLYTYSRDDAYNQIYVSDTEQETMPMWAPPTPPKDDNDVYIDQTMYFLYEPTAMTETQLPPVYVRKEHKKPRIETVTTRKQKQRKEEQPRVPRSLFDRPTAALLKMRREAKLQKLKQRLIKPYRPTAPVVQNKPVIDTAPDHPEWLIHEDWALLQAVQTLLNLPLNLTVVAPAHIPNWDLVADVVNSCSRVYRSPKQCRNRYENVVIPREEGRILYDISPRKQKKTKNIYKTKNNRPMRTSQLFVQDSNNSVTMLYSLRFDSMKGIAGKRPQTLKQKLVNPTMKNPKHAAVLQESGITYDQPSNPLQVAAIRAERIAREKKQSQAAAAAAAEQQLAAQRTQQVQQQQTTQQPQGTTVTSAPTVAQAITQQLQPLVSVASTPVMQTTAVQKMAVGHGVSAVSIARTLGATGNIVVNTPAGLSSNTFAAINKRMNQANQSSLTVPSRNVTICKSNKLQAVTGNLTQAVRARATPLAVHEITTVTSQTGQVATAVQGQTVQATLQRTATASTNLTAQLTATQRIAALTSGTSSGATTVQQQLAQAAVAKGLSPQQINILRHQSIVRPQNPQQPQQLRAQKLSLTAEQIRQPIKRLQAPISQQKVITQPLLTTVPQTGTKQGFKPTMKLTNDQIVHTLALKDLRQQKAAQQAVAAGQAQAVGGQQTGTGQVQLQVTQSHVRQLQTAQIIAQGQTVATSQTPVATLVKSVSAPPGTVPSVSIPVSINVSVGHSKAGVASRATVSQLQQQQQKMHILTQQQQQRKVQQAQTQKVASLSHAQLAKAQIPLIIPQQKGIPFTGQQLIHQIVKQQQHQGNQGATIQQIITHNSQPTIIATVTQSQPTAQMVAKVSLATASQSAQIQSISGSTPITVTQVSPATGVHAPVTLNVATPASQAGGATVVKTTAVDHSGGASHPAGTAAIQVHQIQPGIGQQAKLAALSHSLVQAQAVQQVSSNPQIHQIQTVSQVATPTQSPVPATVVQVQSPVPAPQASSSPTITVQTSGPPQTVPQTAAVATVVTQPQQQQQQQQPPKASPYAMRTRHQPKH